MSSSCASFVAALCTVVSLVGLQGVNAAPTTYDERQDGDLNVAARLENIMILIALPSKTLSTNEVGSEIGDYLSALAAAQAAQAAQSLQPSPPHISHDEEDDEDLVGLFSDEEDSKDAQQQPDKSPDEPQKSEEKLTTEARPKARNLNWNQFEDVTDNKQVSGSLKKELSWDVQESRSNDHNEVSLTANGPYTLVGDGIENCGPERERNSYGICEPAPSTK